PDVKAVYAEAAPNLDVVAFARAGTLKSAADAWRLANFGGAPNARLALLSGRDSFAYVDRAFAASLAGSPDVAFFGDAVSPRSGARSGMSLAPLLEAIAKGEPAYAALSREIGG